MGAAGKSWALIIVALLGCENADPGHSNDVGVNTSDEGVTSPEQSDDGQSEPDPGGGERTEAPPQSAAEASDGSDPVASDLTAPDATSNAPASDAPASDSGGDPDATPSEGTDSAAEAPEVPEAEATAMQICRYYFESICARITECDAPRFRACESPADLCPDILFAEGSSWAPAQALECAQIWSAHSCDELLVDRWPECSLLPGTRALGSECAFDSQCESGTCAGGVTPRYDLTCGICAAPAPLGGECDAWFPCERGLRCEASTCVEITAPQAPDAAVTSSVNPEPPPPPECDETAPCLPGKECSSGACVLVDRGPLPEGAACSSYTECEPGLECLIEVFADEEDEPKVGVCSPLPPIGEPCLPTFGRVGRCAEGGTCNLRPTGDCVALREIGESCGYTQCVAGAFCQTLGIGDEILESHFCYPLRVEGEQCWGHEICAEDLRCSCDDVRCESHTCRPPRREGESCNQRSLLCESSLSCLGGWCVPRREPVGRALELGEACNRYVPFGRIWGDCNEEVEGLECLCSDPKCTSAYCALASLEGESCNENTELCRQGYRCENEVCVALEMQDIEARVCLPLP